MTQTITHKIRLLLIIALLLPAFSGSSVYGESRSANYTLLTDVFSGEGQGGSSSNYTLQCTLGQSSPTGPSSGNDYTIQGGFWHQRGEIPPVEDAAILSITPSYQELGTQASFSTQVEIANVTNLGGFKFEIPFDPSLVCAQSIEDGNFLSSTGRTLLPLPKVIDCDTGIIEYAVSSLGDTPPGPDGNGVLVTIHWQTLNNGGEAELILKEIQLTHTDPTLIPNTSQDATVKIMDNDFCQKNDFNADGKINIVDVTKVAGIYGCNAGDACYNSEYDFDDNGKIELIDVTAVANCYGWSQDAGKRSVYSMTVPRNPVSVRIISDSQTFGIGQMFTMDIMIYGAENLGSFEFELNFDPSVLEGEEIRLGNFLGSTEREDLEVENRIDNETGLMKYAVTTLAPTPPGPNGDGLLVTITWRPKAVGEFTLDMTTLQATDPEANTISIATMDGLTFAVEPTGDIDHSNTIDLSDAILALMISAGMNPDDIYSDADINGDDKIGIEEAVFVLQILSEIGRESG
ncbi:cohesin domain-containing protein [Desulfobacterales bacterium HSG2]|nr:cohesin domain-containing protein [Desulfobacterales bacterium HSG2]